MADFRTHITGSTLVGMGAGAAGYSYGMPLHSCVLAGGLCSVSGILPDLDSDAGVPYRASAAFISAFVPLLLIDRFQSLGWTLEAMVLAYALLYIALRFGVAPLFRRYTVHRGMWHSIPAAAATGLLAFLITDHRHFQLRLFWSAAAVAGFLTHLILDELYSVDFRGIRLKKSFGTALKFWSPHGLWPNISTYAKLAVLILLAWGDPMLIKHVDDRYPIPETSRRRREAPPQPLENHSQEVDDSVWR